MEKENVLRGLVAVARGADALQNRRERFERCGVRALDDETHAHTLHRVARFEQGAHLVLAQRAAVVAHDRHERFHRAAPPVIADVHALPGFDLHKAELFELYQPRRYDGARNAHLRRQLTRRGQLFAEGKLAGEDHVFDLLHEKIGQRKRGDLAVAHSRFLR